VSVRAALSIVLVAACGSSARPAKSAPPSTRPSGCRTIAAGAPLGTIEGAVCLAPGHHGGPLVLAPGAIVWGPPAAVIDRREGGTVVEVGAGATLTGVTVDGTGGVFDRADAAVKLTGDGARVEDVHVVRAVFGITAERVAKVTIRGNRVEGGHDAAIGLRGDPIRLWETQDSIVEDNVVDGGRDVVVWYSSGNHVLHNRITGARYGTHLMYSHHNLVAHNRYEGDVVGVFVMYSHDVTLERNLVEDAGGAAGMAIGLKDSGNLIVRDNAFIHDHTGVYVDQTPLQQEHTLAVTDNLFGRCDVAVDFHATGRRSSFTGNDFVDNATAVTVEGGGDERALTWDANYWSDYAGYDLDGDDRGDVAFELRSFEGDLVDRAPPIAFFRGTAALAAADAVTRLVPMYAPRALLVDGAPRMRPHDWADDLEVLRAD
jgi:nitrous oxidase accessory protein